MFTSEQSLEKNHPLLRLKRDFEGWHNKCKDNFVKMAANYKGLTLALGILVAILIAVTLWISPQQDDISSSEASRLHLPFFSSHVFKTNVGIFKL
ncbi:MAG: hypothetical protein ABIP52_18000 [Cyclobacteriaceae bacterium]